MNEKLMELIRQEWPQLEPEEVIGAGAYGRVFKCRKIDPEVKFVSYEAVKIIMIPSSRDEYPEGEIVETEEEYYTQLKDKAVEEIQSLEKLKSSHIVHINDRRVLRQEDSVGYYILIRMDLLKGLDKVSTQFKDISKKEAETLVIRLLKDMCNAMGVCYQNNIVHRDIKPENIFVSENGDYYLGDFGLAKQISGLSRNLSSRGTEKYAAPEIGKDGCSFQSDIYSLGMVLYKLSNYNRLPFIPFEAKASDINEAQERRLNGEKMPLPENVSPELGEIILKMCEYNPEDRYANIVEVEKDLNEYVARKLHVTGNEEDVQRGEIHIDYSQTTNNVVQNETTINNTTVIGHCFDNIEIGKGLRHFDINSLLRNKAFYIGLAVIVVLCIVFAIKGCSKKEDTVNSIETTVEKTPVAQLPEEKVSETKEDTSETEENPLDLSDTDINGIEKSNEENISENAPIVEEKELLYDKLADMKIVDENGGALCNSCMNTLGDSFKSVPVVFSTSTEDLYSVYYLGKEYEKLIFDVSCYEHDRITSGEFEFNVYADEKSEPIYTQVISRRTPQTHVELDVTDVDFVKFSAEIKDMVHMSKGVILANAIVCKPGFDAMELVENQKTEKNDEPTTQLSDMKIVDETGAIFSKNCSNSLGMEFKDVHVISDKIYDDVYAAFYLGKEYGKLSFDVSCLENKMIKDGDFIFSVYADDNYEPLYTMKMNRVTVLTKVELDVTDVDFIKFAVENDPKGNMHKGVILSSGVLYRKDCEVDNSEESNGEEIEQEAVSEKARLSEMKIVAGKGYLSKSCQDTMGNYYKNTPVVYEWTYENIYSKYYLEKKYSRLSLDVSCLEDKQIHDNNFIFKIYGDDLNHPLYEMNVTRSTELTHLDVDVSGVDFITFSLENDPSDNSVKGVILSSAVLE